MYAWLLLWRKCYFLHHLPIRCILPKFRYRLPPPALCCWLLQQLNWASLMPTLSSWHHQQPHGRYIKFHLPPSMHCRLLLALHWSYFQFFLP